tara:strand:+ start:59 stop:1588 length:1530 start_codon:yes stop_codon:yes gene_type:complete
MDTLSKEYCTNFEWAVLNDSRLHLFKNLIAGLRFGKTYYMIAHHIPYIFNNTDVRLIVCTAPLNGTIIQNKHNMRLMCADNGYVFTETPKESQKILDSGNKVVMYITNQFAWTSEKMTDFFKKQIERKLPICTFMDEAWTWSIDSSENVALVSGNQGGGEYKATWYRMMNRLSKYCPYTYGMSATETFQLEGIVQPTWGDMKYENIIIVRDPKYLAHRLAWFGKATYWTNPNNLYGGTTKEQAFNKLISSIMEIEKITGQKRTALFESNVTYTEETLQKWTNGKYKNEDTIIDVKNMIIGSHFNCDPNDYIGAVMTSNEIYLFNKKGETTDFLIEEDDIYDKLDDENDPLRFLVTIDMAKHGVTIRTLKEFMSFRKVDKKSKLGLIVYQKNQAQGRTLSPNCGKSIEEFFNKHGANFANVDAFRKELNTCNFYLFENPSNRESIKQLQEKFCPTWEDFENMRSNKEICSMGFTFEQHLMEIDHTKEDKIVLDITPKIEKKLIEKKKKCA